MKSQRAIVYTLSDKYDTNENVFNTIILIWVI